jgi:hypothetical protein
MPFDPDSPFVPADPSQWWRTRTLPRIIVQPNAPANGASGNPGQATRTTDYPDDWFVPGSTPSDASYPDDWIYPDNRNVPAPAAGSASPAPSPQQNAAAPAISNRPAAPPDPFAAYWSLVPASRAGAMAWHPPIFLSPDPSSPTNIPASAWIAPSPIFPNSFGQFPLATPAPTNYRPVVGPHGLLGGIAKMLAESDAAAHGLLGGIAKMLAASQPPTFRPPLPRRACSAAMYDCNRRTPFLHSNPGRSMLKTIHWMQSIRSERSKRPQMA